MFDFKIVVLDSPYDQLHDPKVRQILNDTMQMKIDGFKTGYPDGVLPIDGADLVATHILICIEYGEKLLPVCGYKSITPEVAKRHQITFPLENLLSSSDASSHLEVVQSLIKEASKKKQNIVWDYAYTIMPGIRKFREATTKIKDIMTAVHCLYHTNRKSQLSFVSGVVKYKTDKYFESWGYEEILKNNEPLPLINQKSLWGEEVKLLKLKEFSLYSKQLAEKFKELWNERVEFTKEEILIRSNVA